MSGRGFAIDVEISIFEPGVVVRMPAVEDSLPAARQVLRALGDTIAAERELIEDAELALTEACANVVEHAYPDSAGTVEVTLLPRDEEMVISVRDFGRGMPAPTDAPREDPGHGLVMIEGIARRVEIRRDGGTEVEMTLGMGEPVLTTVDGAIPGVQPAERVIRRLVAVIAAQADMPVDRTFEALLVAEMVARNGLRRLVGDQAKLRVSRSGAGVELRMGPLEENGARAAVTESEVPAIGSVVDRLSDDVRVEQEVSGDANVEFLVVDIGPRTAAAKA